MNDSTRDLDQSAEKEAAGKTVQNFGVGSEEIRTIQSNGWTKVSTASVFGMLPSLSIPLDHTIARKSLFSTEAEAHLNGKWGDAPSGKSLTSMATMYNDDLGKLPSADRAYGLLVPLSNVAARAYAKADSVGLMSEKEWSLDDTMKSKLSTKEAQAIGKETKAKRMSHSGSLDAASLRLTGARKRLDAESHNLARRTNDEAMGALDAELKKTEADKAKIEAKKASIAKAVGYIETAGSMIAGGGAFAAANLAGAPAAAETGPNLQPDWVEGSKSAGEGIAKGGGLLSQAVSFGVDLYYGEALLKLENHMTMIRSELASYSQLNAWHAIEAGKKLFDAAVVEYRGAVENYDAVIADRRAEMAEIGAAADKDVDKKGEQHGASEAMLYMETAMELEVALETAQSAGADATSTIDEIAKSVAMTRNMKWGTSAEHWMADNKPFSEVRLNGGKGGPDADALANMQTLVRQWTDAAARVQLMVSKAVKTDMVPFMKDEGFSGKF